MKLLFDENLSPRLVMLLAGEHAGSMHVEQALGRRSADSDVWEFARSNGYTITSKDNDFRQRAFLSWSAAESHMARHRKRRDSSKLPLYCAIEERT